MSKTITNINFSEFWSLVHFVSKKDPYDLPRAMVEPKRPIFPKKERKKNYTNYIYWGKTLRSLGVKIKKVKIKKRPFAYPMGWLQSRSARPSSVPFLWWCPVLPFGAQWGSRRRRCSWRCLSCRCCRRRRGWQPRGDCVGHLLLTPCEGHGQSLSILQETMNF